MAEGDGAIKEFLVTPGWLYVHDVVGGPRSCAPSSWAQTSRPARFRCPPVSAVTGLARLGADSVAYCVESFTEPAAWYSYDPGTGKAVRTSMVMTSPVDFSDCEVVRETATSRDGTKVPLIDPAPQGRQARRVRTPRC